MYNMYMVTDGDPMPQTSCTSLWRSSSRTRERAARAQRDGKLLLMRPARLSAPRPVRGNVHGRRVGHGDKRYDEALMGACEEGFVGIGLRERCCSV